MLRGESLKGSDILQIHTVPRDYLVEDNGMIGIYLGVRRDVPSEALPHPVLRSDVHIMDVNWLTNEEDSAVKLVEDVPVLAHLFPFGNMPCMIELAATHNLFRLCEVLVKINPKSVFVYDQTSRYLIHRAVVCLSVECCRILLDARDHSRDHAIVETCVRSSRFSGVDRSRYIDCLWTLIDYGRCPVSEKTICGSEPVRCVMRARVHSRDAALAMAGLYRLKSPIIGKYNGRDAMRLISLAVWMTRYQWLDVETERCKRHRKEHPSMPYGV